VFSNKDNALYPNQFVNSRLLVDMEHNALLIPTSTIQHNGTDAFVYVLENNFAHMVYIKPGVTDGGTTAVTGVKQGEIKDGDVLANSSFDKLQDKSPIRVSKEPIPASTVGSSAP
jgi:multidrug efflux system membrane fusion protein